MQLSHLAHAPPRVSSFNVIPAETEPTQLSAHSSLAGVDSRLCGHDLGDVRTMLPVVGAHCIRACSVHRALPRRHNWPNSNRRLGDAIRARWAPAAGTTLFGKSTLESIHAVP